MAFNFGNLQVNREKISTPKKSAGFNFGNLAERQKLVLEERNRQEQERVAQEKQKIIKKSQEEAQRYQAEADKYNSRVGILEGIKSLPKEIGKMAVGTGAIIGDIATRLSPLEGVRNIASGVKTSFQRPEGESAIDAYKRGILESQARPTLYEKAQTKMSGQEFTFPQMDKTAGLPTGLVTQPEYRKALTSAMEAPTYVFGGKPVATAGKGLLARVLSRTVATQPEAIIEAGLATAGEEKPTLKSAGMNYLAATLLMSGISNTVGEIRISRNSKEVTETKKELEEVYNNELPDEAKDDLAEAFSQGVKKEDILENAKKTIGDTAEEVVETPVKREPRKLKAGEFAPISKEIQETTGKKLTAKETLEIKDKIEQGYTKEEIIDEIINPRRTEPTPKEVKSVVIAEKEKSSFEQTRDAAIKRAKEQDARTQSNGKYSKGTAMEFAGIKRKIEGNPTYKEAEKAKKYLESNHQGKEVVVNGVKGKIEKMSFGRVGVKFGDGTIKFFDKDLVKSEKVTKSNVLDYLKKEGERNLDLYKRLYDIKDTPKRTKMTSKPPKVESDIPTPKVDDIAEYVKNKSTKFRVADEVDDLISQAKKMKSEGKSFDEFINAQGTPVYRGGEKFTGDVGERGLPLTTNKNIAETFQKEKIAFRKNPAGQIMGLKPEDIVLEEYVISPNARIATKKDIPNNVFEAYKKSNPSTKPEIAEPIISKWARDNGFDAVDFSTLGKTSAKEAEIKILNKDVLKTKSQLLDIWNSELISGKATKKVTSTTAPPTKTIAKKGESITAKKLNEVMPDEYKINEDYDKITLKGELDRASKEIAKDKDEALRKAFSRDERVDRRIAKLEEFAQIAKDNKDYEAVNRLFTQANKIGTETAQGLNMLKALYAVNPEYKYMQEIINARLAKVKFGVKDIEKATKEVREIISRKGKDLKEKTKQAFKVKDAQELLNSIMCK